MHISTLLGAQGAETEKTWIQTIYNDSKNNIMCRDTCTMQLQIYLWHKMSFKQRLKSGFTMTRFEFSWKMIRQWHICTVWDNIWDNCFMNNLICSVSTVVNYLSQFKIKIVGKKWNTWKRRMHFEINRMFIRNHILKGAFLDINLNVHK